MNLLRRLKWCVLLMRFYWFGYRDGAASNGRSVYYPRELWRSLRALPRAVSMAWEGTRVFVRLPGGDGHG